MENILALKNDDLTIRDKFIFSAALYDDVQNVCMLLTFRKLLLVAVSLLKFLNKFLYIP